MKIQELSIDLETYSDVDISKCGVYKYAESDNFEILLFGVSVDGGDVTVYDLACGDTIPEEILDALTDDTITKWAFNACNRFSFACASNIHWCTHFQNTVIDTPFIQHGLAFYFFQRKIGCDDQRSSRTDPAVYDTKNNS